MILKAIGGREVAVSLCFIRTFLQVVRGGSKERRVRHSAKACWERYLNNENNYLLLYVILLGNNIIKNNIKQNYTNIESQEFK